MSIKNLYDKKHSTFAFTGDYATVFGRPSTSGTWLIYGAEKNGKTWAALLLANYLSTHAPVLYISAEQGTDADFVAAVLRAGISHDNRSLAITDGTHALPDILAAKLGPRRKTKIVIVDNITFYKKDLANAQMHRYQKQYPDVLFIYLAHEENGRPYGATAQMAKRLAKVIIHIEGLRAHISGRVPGGTFDINDTKAQLYWGATPTITN